MDTWTNPPIIKLYEALGAIGDNRVRILDDHAEVDSSSRNKTYTVTYDLNRNAIRSNDNGSYWKEYLGYPAIAVLMLLEKVVYDSTFTEALANIPWKDINTQYKNDYDKVIAHVHDLCRESGTDVDALQLHIQEIANYLQSHPFHKLGKRTPPPHGY